MHHFAHKQESSCPFSLPETPAHHQAKILIRDALKKRRLAAEIEWIVDCLPGDRRADVMVWGKNNEMLAIEVQQSSISLQNLEARTESYFRSGVRVLWLILVTNKKFEATEVVNGENKKWIERYPARHWERWIHTFNYGHLWFFNIDDTSLWKGKLASHELYVENSSWYEDGEEQTAGGYFRYSKRFKELTLEGPFKLDDILLVPFFRKKYCTKDFNFPEGNAATLTPKNFSKTV